MKADLLQKVEELNTLIELYGWRYGYGIFTYDEDTNLIRQTECQDFFSKDQSSVIGTYTVDAFQTFYTEAKLQIYKGIKKTTDTCNSSIKEAKMVSTYGIISFDETSGVFTKNTNEIKTSYPIKDGLHMIRTIQNAVDLELYVRDIAGKIFYTVCEAEENALYETDDIHFIDFEGSNTVVKCFCNSYGAWSTFDLGVYLIGEDTSKTELLKLNDVPGKPTPIRESIHRILTTMQENESTGFLSEYLASIVSDYNTVIP